VTSDLPADLEPASASPARGEPASAVRSYAGPGQVCGSGRGQRAAVAAWLFTSSLNLAIWAVVSIAATSWVYPWWIWVAGPWGAVLLTGWVAGRVAGSPEQR